MVTGQVGPGLGGGSLCAEGEGVLADPPREPRAAILAGVPELGGGETAGGAGAGAAAGGMDYVAVGMAIKRVERRLVSDPKLRRLTGQVLEKS